MYRIPIELGRTIVNKSKDVEIPGILHDLVTPFVCHNTKAVGTIQSLIAFCTDAEYLIELALTPIEEDLKEWSSEIEGCWLYRREELTMPITTVSLPPQFLEDANAPFDGEDVDITNCCIMLPSVTDKLTCVSVNTLERLFELEPGLKECLDL